MGFIRDIRRDFKADCEKYGKAAIYFLVLTAIGPPFLLGLFAFYGVVLPGHREALFGVVGGKVEAVMSIWVVAAEMIPAHYRLACFLVSLGSMLAVGFVTPLACEGIEIPRKPRLAGTLRVALAVSGVAVVYGLFAVTVLCIDPAGPRLLVLSQVLLTFFAVLYGIIRVSSAAAFK